MANLDTIKRLNEQYHKKSTLTNDVKLFEAFDIVNPQDIEKALKNELASLGPNYTRYFDLGLPSKLAFLFIDVCNFSTRFSDLDGESISEFFDEFYNKIIPIIYKHGGEIDKIIGDGIICVFGPPFLNSNYLNSIKAADACAREIIAITMGTKFSSKIAFHSGEIKYYKNKSAFYNEFTIVGKPLTELFRLESISQNEGINYFSESDVFRFYHPDTLHIHQGMGLPTNKWMHLHREIPTLNGVNFTGAYSLKYYK